MGFYGNITNTARTSFVFDKIYSNRVNMDKNCLTDGIFIGRHVLVEYDENTPFDTIPTGYIVNDKFTTAILLDQEDEFAGIAAGATSKRAEDKGIYYVPANCFYKDCNEVEEYILYEKDEDTGRLEYRYISEEEYLEDNTDTLNQKSCKIINGEVIPLVVNGIAPSKISEGDKFKIAPYKRFTLVDYDGLQVFHIYDDDSYEWHDVDGTESELTKNFVVDKKYYQQQRGYDSTVWQKCYIDGSERYVKIADLNTVVPIFEASADAPTPIAIPPHVDTDNTNINYSVHMQSPWSFRIKGATPDNKMPKIEKLGNIAQDEEESTIPSTSDTIVYPSDMTTSWKGNFYDVYGDNLSSAIYNPVSQKWEDKYVAGVPAAIYFNKKGFDPAAINYSSDLLNKDSLNYNPRIKGNGWADGDRVTLNPSGYSGRMYNAHGDGDYRDKPAVDTQELSIMLPSLGNAVANLWDLVYGGRETNETIRQTDKRNLDISWEDADNVPIREGLRLITDKFMAVTLTQGELLSYLTNPSNKTYYYLDEKEQYIAIPSHVSKPNEAIDKYWDEDRKYFVSGEGFTYNKREVDTLAGCINSAHDLMGMIIVAGGSDIRPEKLTIDTGNVVDNYRAVDEDKIYYFDTDGTYRRKKLTYGYKDASVVYRQAIITEDDYIPGVYYYLSGGKYIPATDRLFDSKKSYFTKHLDDSINKPPYERVVLNEYEANKYTKTVSGDYMFDNTGVPRLNTDYYDVEPDEDPAQLTATYQKYEYYTKNTNADYIISREDNPVMGETYYKIKEDTIKSINRPVEYKESYYEGPDPTKLEEDDADRSIHGWYYTGTTEDTGEPIYELVTHIYEKDRFYYLHDFTPLVYKPEDGILTDAEINAIANEEDRENARVANETKKQELYNIHNRNLTAAETIGFNRYYVKKTFTKNDVTSDYYIYEEPYEYYEPATGNYNPNEIYYVPDNSYYRDGNEKPTYKRNYIVLDAEIKINSMLIQDPNDPNKIITQFVASAVNIDGIYKTEIVPFIPQSFYYKGKSVYYWTAKDENGNIIYVESEKNPTEFDDDGNVIGLEYTVHAVYEEWKALTATELTRQYDLAFGLTPGSAKVFTLYYQFGAEQQSDFYIANRFWYQTPGKDWVKDRKVTATEGRVYYYNIKATKINKTYYIPNYYYIEDTEIDGEYKLCTDLFFDPTQRYYKKNEVLFVKSDSRNVFPRGSSWNYKLPFVPASAQIAFKIPYYTMEIMPSFGRTLNTLNGLILKINSLINIDDKDSRDLDNFQGCINSLSDIIQKFNELDPNKVLMTDTYGRVNSGSIVGGSGITVVQNAKEKTVTISITGFEALMQRISNLENRVAELEK